ncbi:FABP family protein [Sulfidibacter corallicola]|uniref:FABP family protein n=1 Tax=Sulfidibacter corallicola TaxID=2818388 RepID=A0A8A4TRM3_SULCO|nr:heme-binding beta-barrel domain-containing protein [Sulfidibacter corallicola]QTD52047.1 FABP family protein [Sulfidibacter corallicola]
MTEKDPTAEVNYGPLAALIGTWQGDKGLDLSPEPDGTEENPYYETIEFQAGGDLENAEKQTLAIVPYTQIVRRKSNDEVFHHEVGYWLYDAEADLVMHSLAIPRAVCVLAGGSHKGEASGENGLVLDVSAKLGDPDWGILQSPFMRENAKTVAFSHAITIKGDHMSYRETTYLEIYGKSFDHVDSNELTRQKA